MSATADFPNATEEHGNIALTLAKLMQEWNDKLATSVQVRRASDNLNLHKQKVDRVMEKMDEMEAKRRRIEESLKPPLLRFFDVLEKQQHVTESLLRRALHQVQECYH